MDLKQLAFRLEVIALGCASCNYFSLHANYFSSMVIALEPHAIHYIILHFKVSQIFSTWRNAVKNLECSDENFDATSLLQVP